MMVRTEFLEKAVILWTRRLALIGLLGLLALSGATIADVFLRYVFNAPIHGLSDLGQLVIILMVAASLPAALAGRHQVTVRLVGKVTPWRVREGLDLLGHTLMLLVFLGLGWQLALYAVDLFANGQTTSLLGIPMWPSWAVAAGLVLLCAPVQGLIVAVQLGRVLSDVEPGRTTVSELDSVSTTDAGAV